MKGSAYWMEKAQFQSYLRSIFAQLSRAGIRIVVGMARTIDKCISGTGERTQEKYGTADFNGMDFAETERLKYQSDHAGANETSIVMAVRPELVDFGQVKKMRAI